ncbi:S1 family peptidase [Rhodococcus sp. Z13]|uniref:S1 family peptidase n=1 Tax=Rhodococcus sacchari TaxID=2962047 RepID=A0ACD4DH32_9NOCA|nr:S1 family peptidase [Rhodococcus sp. Z13]UYP19255.1 S1 family peptidase [Rhodococcus sp. Z13]
MFAAGTASAGGGDDRIVLRPGDGITFSAEPAPGWCSVAAIGHDAGGRLVAVTAGHCRQTGSSPIWKVDEQHRGPIGTESEVAGTGSIDLLGMPTDEIADYAVLVLDETRVRGSNTSAPNDRNERVVLTSIGGLDGGAAIVGRQCAAGRSTSVACTIADEVLVGEDLLASSLLMRPGDSGGPLVRTDTGEWIGLSVGYRFDDTTLPDIPLEAPRWGIYQRADRIVAELDERGGVGAGFRLVVEP